jgi:RNA polymerase subunit RPABC4/transcription elongation factor Spt4
MPDQHKCHECGYLNEQGAAFCGNCGSPLRAAGPRPLRPPSTLPEEVAVVARLARDSETNTFSGSSPRECPSCHYAAAAEDLFCRRCGASLVRRPLFCKRCGDPVEADERFCNRCGLPLG